MPSPTPEDVARRAADLLRDELLDLAARTRVWLTVSEVSARTGRGRTKIVEALQRGAGHREAGGYRPGDLRGYQEHARAGWAIHRDDADAWVRGELPATPRSTSGAA